MKPASRLLPLATAVSMIVGVPASGSTACGDANADGRVTVVDVSTILRSILGTVGCDPRACDVNSSGSVTMSDVIAALRAVVAGDAVVDCPDVIVAPGTDIQTMVDGHAEGTTFLIGTGIHRLQHIRPKSADVFIGAPGAVLSGARLLTVFARHRRYFVATGQTQQGQPTGTCESPDNDPKGHTACEYPEDLFIDGRPLTRVVVLENIEAGSWYFDYDTDRIYFVDDPAHRIVETSVARHAFEYGRDDRAADNVTIRGLVIEKYANPAQHGAIHGQDDAGLGKGWTIRDNEIRLNHGVGVRVGDSARALGNHIHHNGQLGIAAGGTDIVIDNNEISHNNTHGFSFRWEAGGAKFVETRNLVVRNNHVHDNVGPGLWTDTNNTNTTYENNLVLSNAGSGIFHEISYSATITGNTVKANGFGFAEWLYGAGIMTANSSDVEIYDNVVSGNANGITLVMQNRGAGSYGLFETRNVHVHDNTITMLRGLTGLAQDIDDESYFSQKNNRFENNTYLIDESGKRFAWNDARRNKNYWVGVAKQDTGGTFLPLSAAPRYSE